MSLACGWLPLTWGKFIVTEIYLHTYIDSDEARRAIFEYIEGWYNRKRIHSVIGYMTLQQKEDEKLKKVA